ncbi:hypothetical protein QUB70_27275 [Microcoleus sp. A003_D6]
MPHAQSDVKEIVTVSFGISSLIPALEVQRDTLVADEDKALYDDSMGAIASLSGFVTHLIFRNFI